MVKVSKSKLEHSKIIQKLLILQQDPKFKKAIRLFINETTR